MAAKGLVQGFEEPWNRVLDNSKTNALFLFAAVEVKVPENPPAGHRGGAFGTWVSEENTSRASNGATSRAKVAVGGQWQTGETL